MKRLLLAFLILCGVARGQFTQITDTITTPISGVLFTGTLQISNPLSVGVAGNTVGQWAQTIQITNGAISLQLAPTDTTTPPGTQYVFRYTPQLNNGNPFITYCSIPTSATPITLSPYCSTTPGNTVSLNQLLPGTATPGECPVLDSSRRWIPTACPGTGTVTSVNQTVPSWLSVSGVPVTGSGTLAISPATGQTSHQVIGTCGSATSFGPCALTAPDIPALSYTILDGTGTTLPGTCTDGHFWVYPGTTFSGPLNQSGVYVCSNNIWQLLVNSAGGFGKGTGGGYAVFNPSPSGGVATSLTFTPPQYRGAGPITGGNAITWQDTWPASTSTMGQFAIQNNSDKTLFLETGGSSTNSGPQHMAIGEYVQAGEIINTLSLQDISLCFGLLTHGQTCPVVLTSTVGTPASQFSVSYPSVFASTVSANSGTNIIYRCVTAGATLPVGSLTINAAACGSTVDTGFRAN